MHDADDYLHDYFRAPVPAERRVGGWGIALVILGIGITLPIFYLGSQLGRELGVADSAKAFALGCTLLGIIAAVTAVVGARTGLSSYMILRFAFGRVGAKAVNGLMAVGLLGYFGATADIFGRALREGMRAELGVDAPAVVWTVIGSVAMTLTALFGYRAIEGLARFAVPLMAAFLLYAVVLAVGGGSAGDILAYTGVGERRFGLAVSAVVGSCIQLAVLMPDITRFARDVPEALKSVSGLVIGYPLVFLAAAVPTVAIGETDLMKVMVMLGVGLPALVTLVFATWTTNTGNLYSTSMTLATIVTRVPEWRITVCAAAVGTCIAALGIMDRFMDFLLVLAVATPPVGGVYLVDYFHVRRGRYDVDSVEHEPPIGWPAMFSWLIGCAAGGAASLGFVRLTTVPACDALLAAMIAYLVCSRRRPVPRRAMVTHAAPLDASKERPLQ